MQISTFINAELKSDSDSDSELDSEAESKSDDRNIKPFFAYLYISERVIF